MDKTAANEDVLLEWASQLRFSDLPASAVEATLALILDHFTCIRLGLEMPWTQVLMRVARADNSAETRALINGTAGHGFDFDDLHFPTMSHPGCVVIPAAVAMGQETNATGHELIAAVAAGYELMLRPGIAAGLAYGELGWHATGVLGPLGAATAATKLLAGPDAVPDAVGLAASMGAGIKAFNEFGPGWVKRLHAGRAAEAGIFAARLARDGYLGPRRALSARFGLARVLGLGDADIGALDRGLGDPFLVEDIYIKPYAACGAVHGAVQAATQIAATCPGLQERNIASVTVGISPRAIAQNSNTDPADAMAAQYSTEVSVAIGLLGGAEDPRRFMAAGDDSADPARVLARRTVLELDHRAAAAYPDPNEGVVTVRLADGSSLSRRGSSSPASSRGWQVAASKFTAVSRGRLSPREVDEALSACLQLAQEVGASALLAVLARPASVTSSS